MKINKKENKYMMRPVIFLLILLMLSGNAFGGPSIPGFYGSVPDFSSVLPTAVPIPLPGGTIDGATIGQPFNNKLVINQNKSKAIIDWQSFNIGKEAWTHFNQQGNTDWVALNRIYDQNPSQIFGKLTADGKVYLINQNGILFGVDSQVNIHSLIASSLNANDDDFLNGALKFKAEDFRAKLGPTRELDTVYDSATNTPGPVSNHGNIETDELGEVFLIAPTVENNGTILSPVGQIGLVAATEAQMVPDINSGRSALVVNIVDGAGEAGNYENGWIIADIGTAGMYGRVVNQNGLIRSISAVKKAGLIELHASERVSTGAQSLTTSPVSDSSETVHESFEFNGGTIDISGLKEAGYDSSGNLLSFAKTATGLVEHKGVIEASSGTIDIYANQRIYLESGSKIDVAGLWVDKSADGNLVEVQLNSVQLKDDYGQKEGLLKGQKIKIDAYLGSAIGDVSSSLKSEEVTAQEHATKGGTIIMDAGDSGIVIKQGAKIDFSGGGVRYAAGFVDSTKLLTGTNIVDISEADEWVSYDKIMGLHETYYERFGITEEFNGLFSGGANAVKNYSSERVEGSDAGKLSFFAKRIVLDGELDGSVLKGLYQTEDEESENKSGNPNSRGTSEPRGGRFVIGVAPLGQASPETQNFTVDEVIIRENVEPLPSAFGATDMLSPVQKAEAENPLASVLSAQILSNAGLGRLEIYANKKITIDKGARILLPSRRLMDDLEIENEPELATKVGGYFIAAARSIDVMGEINVPAGEIDLSLKDNVTSFENIGGLSNPLYVPIQQRIYLADGSKLSAAGERIDNSGAGSGENIKTGQIAGGSVKITGSTILRKGSAIDVSGGYVIDQDGKVSGGNAGNIEIGSVIALDGTLKGYSLPGNEGGSLTVGGRDVAITTEPHTFLPDDFTPDSVIPAFFQDKLVLNHSLLSKTGFTHISVESRYGLDVEDGVTLRPSLTKLSYPLSGRIGGSNGTVINNTEALERSAETVSEFTEIAPEMAGSTSIKLVAGKGISQLDAEGVLLNVRKGAEISMPPGGVVSLQGPEVILEGTISAPAGEVSLKAIYSDLTLKEGSRILAQGYNKAETTVVMKGYPVGYTILSGGDVNLEAVDTDIVIEEGALIDVSGSDPVRTFVKTSSGMPAEFMVAGNPGSLTLSYGGNLAMGGELSGSAKIKGLKGGSLAINSKKDLLIEAKDVDMYQASGFDDLTLKSILSLTFSDSMDIRIARKLTLDAPEIIGSGQDMISLSAPWILLTNTYYPAAGTAEPGQAALSLSADWIDMKGQVTLSGFSYATLNSGEDIRVSDMFYSQLGSSSPAKWKGGLETAGDLTLRADRIYPETLSQFTFQSAGLLTVLSGDNRTDSPIVSAGGNLTIRAKNIEVAGFLAAPMGQVALEGVGTGSSIHLAPGCMITTEGSDSVNYGSTDETFWTIPDRAANTLNTVDVEEVPAKSVVIDGDNVFVEEGAEINLSGGGAVFAYKFFASPTGSNDPLKKTGRYVIMPGNSMMLPGDAVYLEGGAGISAGFYSLLPEEYAFLPGALILTDIGEAGQSYIPGQNRTAEGYPVVAGYSTVTGTDIRSLKPKGYSIRRAEEVLQEGYFALKTLYGGDAGSLSITGDTTILGGTFRMKAASGFKKGSITLAGKQIEVGDTAGIIPADFDFNMNFPDSLKNKLLIQKDMLDEMDLREIVLGDVLRTDVVEIKGGSSIRAELVTLKAKDEIILRSGAEIHAVSDSGGGTATIIANDSDNDGIGKFTLEPGSLVHASDEYYQDIRTIDFRGDIEVDHSVITLGSKEIFFVPETYVISDNPDGFYIKQSNWDKFSIFETIGLKSDTNINFLGDFNLSAAEVLRLDASRITGSGTDFVNDPGADVTLSAPIISLFYTGNIPLSGNALSETGTLNLIGNEVRIGHGQMLLDGFSKTNITSRGNTIFQGEGSLATQGDLNITTARVTTSYDKDSAGKYKAVNFSVNTEGAIGIYSNGAVSGAGLIPGGILNLAGRRIDIGGLIETSSTKLSLNATGSDTDGIFLSETGRIINRGSEYGKGGSVELRSDLGNIDLAEGSLIDVSAGAQGDAGNISLYGPEQNVKTNGNLMGYGIEDGDGGSFYLDTLKLASFNTLYEKLSTGGFNNEINVRARIGDITIGSSSPAVPEQLVRAKDLKVVSDDGAIFVQQNAYIDVSGDEGGGSVELCGKDAVVLFGGSKINAKGTLAGADGGDVTLGASEGYVVLLSGSEIDVSSGDGGQGGTVNLRAPRFENDVLLYPLGGTIRGASGVYAEAFTAYNDTVITTSDINTWKTQTQTYMNNAGTIENRLLSGLALQKKDGSPDISEILHLLPGIEIRSAGDLALVNNWDLTTTTWRFGGEPGVLTLKAAVNLDINADLVDHPTLAKFNLFPHNDKKHDSWAFNLIAGADLGSADCMSVQSGSGNMTIGVVGVGGKMVYTESAPIRFASGGDTLLSIPRTSGYMITPNIRYTLGTFDDDITGRVMGNLILNGGVIQSATGDIEISVAKDLELNQSPDYNSSSLKSMGSIRTTGKHPLIGEHSSNQEIVTFMSSYWDYAGGGDIVLDVGGAVNGWVNQNSTTNTNAWDNVYKNPIGSGAFNVWAASYQSAYSGYETTEGLATMAGGNLSIRTGGDFFSQTGTFGKGDMNIYAGGSIDGRFLIKEGNGEIHAMAGFGVSKIDLQSIELFNAKVNLSARGDIRMGSIFNPTIANSNEYVRKLLYDPNSTVILTSVTGDVSLLGDSPFYTLDTYSNGERILPPTLEIYAGRDILLSNAFSLAPSPSGNLVLNAGRDIDGLYHETTETSKIKRSEIVVSDISPDEVYAIANLYTGNLFNRYEHASIPVHIDDSIPISIKAGGDIKNLQLFLSKKADIMAGKDIRDIFYYGQNIGDGDVSTIKAGGNIIFSTSTSANNDTGIVQGGPGTLIIQAGNNIDLGTSKGIQSIGNGENTALGTKGSDLIVAAGYTRDFLPAETENWFSELHKAVKDYSDLLSDSEMDEAKKMVEKARDTIIYPLLGNSNGEKKGNINMLLSQISTGSEKDYISIISGGDINVGKSTFVSNAERESTGIYTAAGGAINIFSVGDVNVNESRIMTFGGGDITMWSDRGNVNAGRGSKTAINVSKATYIPTYEYITINGKTIQKVKSITRIFKPPAVGSGIRCLTYDPDGYEGPQTAPPIGDIYVAAPEGVIDAGEAGIAGRNVILGATQVLNAQNISFTGTGVGVPTSTESVNLGSLTGAGALSEVSKLSEQMAGLASEKGEAAQRAEKMLDDFVAKWLDVKFIGFDSVSVE
ncbi:MAG: filamentous hemagglutinin family protein [Desulfobacterales bacterium]